MNVLAKISYKCFLSGPYVTNFSFYELSLHSETISDFSTIILQGGHTHQLNLKLSISGVHVKAMELKSNVLAILGGIIFNETSDITIRGVTFVGCGSTQPSTIASIFKVNKAKKCSYISFIAPTLTFLRRTMELGWLFTIQVV